MPYVTESDLIALGLPESAIEDANREQPDSVTRCLSAAHAEFDAAARRFRYVVPLANPDDAVKQHVAAIASWAILCVRGVDPDNPATDSAYQRCKDARMWLDKVANGKASLDAPTVDGPIASSGNFHCPQTFVRRFSDDWGDF